MTMRPSRCSSRANSGASSPPQAVELSPAERVLAVKNALERSDLQIENQRYKELVGDGPRMIGKSLAFQRAVNDAAQVASR